jgi:hypothetical protein
MDFTIKDKVIEFLSKNPGPYYPKKLSDEMEISYPTMLKCIDILCAEGKITLEDLGTAKVIKLKTFSHSLKSRSIL